MRTAIFTARDQTTLTIEVPQDEVVDLVQMGQTQRIARLSRGVTSVTVGAGVFKLVSKGLVSVTADMVEARIVVTASNKGDWPDLREVAPMLPSDGDVRAVMSFLNDAKSKVPPL